MATTINAGDDAKRGEMFYVDPFQIMLNEQNRGRYIPPTEAKIIEMALSLNEHSQKEPVKCRKMKVGNESNKLVLAFGFTRTAAARLLREGFQHPETNEIIKNSEFLLHVMLINCSDNEAFIANIVENEHRNATSDIDDAHNQNRLREQMGKTDAEIARLYNYKDQQKVSRLKKLLLLDEPLQHMVHFGELATTAAIDLLDLPAEARQEVIDNAKKNGKVNGSLVREQVRDHILADANGEGNPVVAGAVVASDDDMGIEVGNVGNVAENNGNDAVIPAPIPARGSVKARSLRDVRKFCDARFGKEATISLPPSPAAFLKTLRSWIDGKITDKVLENGLLKLLKADPAEAEVAPAPKEAPATDEAKKK